jgi:hypothetical protein
MDVWERMGIGGVQRAPSFDIDRAADPSHPCLVSRGVPLTYGEAPPGKTTRSGKIRVVFAILW